MDPGNPNQECISWFPNIVIKSFFLELRGRANGHQHWCKLLKLTFLFLTFQFYCLLLSLSAFFHLLKVSYFIEPYSPISRRTVEFFKVREAMDRFLKEPPLNISNLNHRQRRDKLNPANTTMAYLLEKTVGSRKEDQATWLLDYLKRLFPKGGHLKQVIEDF